MSEIKQEDVDRMVKEAERRGEDRGRADIKKKIEEQAQCTICYRITTKVLQCPNGHLTCENCLKKCDSENCATCRCSLTDVKQGTYIRPLAMEILIDSVDLKRSCNNPSCDFSASKIAMNRHKNRCLQRLVPCPMYFCSFEVELTCLMTHLKTNCLKYPIEELKVTKTSHYSETIKIPNEDFISVDDLEVAKFKIIKLKTTKFIPKFVRSDGIYYTWIQVLGGHKKASKYSVTITVGKGTDTRITHQGKVFPIDVKQEQIIKEQSGVVSFLMKEMFLSTPEDGKEVTVQYAFSRSTSPSFPPNIGEMEQANTINTSNYMIPIKSDSDSDEDSDDSDDASSEYDYHFNEWSYI